MCKRYMDWLPLTCPQLGAWPATQACALPRNRTSDLLVCRLVLNPLSYTSQGLLFLCLIFFLFLPAKWYEDPCIKWWPFPCYIFYSNLTVSKSLPVQFHSDHPHMCSRWGDMSWGDASECGSCRSQGRCLCTRTELSPPSSEWPR